MKTLAQQMSIYARYHRDFRNRLTHFIGVPAIMFALMLALGWLRLPVGPIEISAAVPILTALLIYYLALDVSIALAMTVFTVAMLMVSDMAARLPFPTSLTIFGMTFIGGWVLQLVGHVFEGRRPALVDNLFQVIIAPIYLMAEVFFTLGYKLELRAEVERLAAEAEKKPRAPMSASRRLRHRG